MKKIIAFLLIALLIFLTFYAGYDETGKIWMGFLYIGMAIIFGGIGGLIGVFIVDTFKSPK